MTPPAPNSLARHLRVPGYLFFGIAMILPLLDLLVSVYPIRLGTVQWRFGAVGFLSGAIGAPLLILFFIFALALFAGDRKVIMTVGVVAALIALLLVASTGSFVLDALQMKRRIQAAAQQRFMMVSLQAMMKIILQAISAIVLSITAFRSLNRKTSRTASSRSESRASGSLVMGRPSSSRTSAPTADTPQAEVTTPTDE